MLYHVQAYYRCVKYYTQNVNKLESKKGKLDAEEVAVLLEEVDKRKPYLFGKLSGFLTNDRKKAQWREVVAAVNAVSKTNRTEAEVR